MITESNSINYSKEVTDRFLQLCREGKIFYNDQVRIFTNLQEIYKPITIAKFAKDTGKNYKVIQEQFRTKKLAGDNFGGVDFIYKALN